MDTACTTTVRIVEAWRCFSMENCRRRSGWEGYIPTRTMWLATSTRCRKMAMGCRSRSNSVSCVDRGLACASIRTSPRDLEDDAELLPGTQPKISTIVCICVCGPNARCRNCVLSSSLTSCPTSVSLLLSRPSAPWLESSIERGVPCCCRSGQG